MAWLLSDQWILKIHLCTLEQFLSHSPSPWAIRCRQHLLHILDQWEKTNFNQRMRERLWSGPLFTQGIITLLFCSHIWNPCNTPPKFQSTLELQTTNMKFPWSSYKLQFGKKALFISTYFSISKLKQTVLVKRPSPMWTPQKLEQG